MATRLRFTTARELFDAFPTASQDMKAEPTDEPSLDFCRARLAGKVPEDAITFCAYLLPRRVAVWWGHECLTQLPDLLDEQDRRMLALARDWVSEPEEDRRYAALNEGMAAREKTPGVWIALAAGWSGGNIAPAGMEPVASQVFFTPKAVNAGILFMLARVAIADRAAVLSGFVEMGINLAETS
ncbi:DUF6931 family protein [Arvimicrobium flavum]|uniref:DUF6931 family protein n=1 Tax=Arvimicrobium flavum TaxID=3393320 RepID=UPI00237ACAC4|nr:hypothetical protein [Mesorhizobium shangrilense]